MKPMPEHGFCAHYVSVSRPLGISGGHMWLKRNGRHEETRTPDLYRVKVAL